MASSATYAANASKLDNNLENLLDDLQSSVSKSNGPYFSTPTTPHYSSRSSTLQSAAKRDNYSTDEMLQDLQNSISKNASSPTPYYNTVTKRDVYTIDGSRNSPLRTISPLDGLDNNNSQGVTTTVEKYVTTGPAGTGSGIPGLEMLDAELQDVQPGQTKTVAYKQVSYHYDKKQEGTNLEPWATTESLMSKNDSSIVDNFNQRTFEESRSSSVNKFRDSPDFARSNNNQEIMYKADVTTRTIPIQHQSSSSKVESRSASSSRDHKVYKESSFRTEPSPVAPRKNVKTVRTTDETEEFVNVERNIPISITPNTKVTTTVKTYSYDLPGQPETVVTNTTTKNVSHQLDEQKSSSFRQIRTPTPSRQIHREEKKLLVEGYRTYRPVSPPRVQQSTTVTRNEEFVQSNNGRITRDVTDHSSSNVSKNERMVYYEREPIPCPLNETTKTTTIKQFEEHFINKPQRVYYPTTESSTTQSKNIYITRSEDTMPRPFPVSERPSSPQKPPRRLEDLMASFSDSEEFVEVRRPQNYSTSTKESSMKKEVEYSSSRGKAVSGPPVYYPPGSGEFTRKEEMSMMSRSGHEGGEMYKERQAWEYGSSSKSKQKDKQKKAVVPVCLPLCCALPCTIM